MITSEDGNEVVLGPLPPTGGPGRFDRKVGCRKPPGTQCRPSSPRLGRCVRPGSVRRSSRITRRSQRSTRSGSCSAPRGSVRAGNSGPRRRGLPRWRSSGRTGLFRFIPDGAPPGRKSCRAFGTAVRACVPSAPIQDPSGARSEHQPQRHVKQGFVDRYRSSETAIVSTSTAAKLGQGASDGRPAASCPLERH